MDWHPYIKASWQLVLESEGKTQTFLQEDLEAYLVHMIARTMTNPFIPPDIICLEFMKAKNNDDYRNIGDSCLFVDAWDVKRAKTVEQDYYEKMGKIAYGFAALDIVAENFNFLSKVLRNMKC